MDLYDKILKFRGNFSSPENILSIYVTNKLTKGDLDDLASFLKQKEADWDHPHLLMIMKDFKGWEDTAAAWKDLQLDAEYIGHFDRIAIVGDKKWQWWGAQLVNPITKKELKYFPIDLAENAWEWISEEHEEI